LIGIGSNPNPNFKFNFYIWFLKNYRISILIHNNREIIEISKQLFEEVQASTIIKNQEHNRDRYFWTNREEVKEKLTKLLARTDHISLSKKNLVRRTKTERAGYQFITDKNKTPEEVKKLKTKIVNAVQIIIIILRKFL